MIDIINWILSITLLVVMGWFAYMSSVMVSEKKERQRKGLTDYYDNPINRKCMGGEDDYSSKSD